MKLSQGSPAVCSGREGPDSPNGDVLLDVLEISGSIGLSRKWILPPCGNILFSRLLTFANVFIQSDVQ